MRYGLRNEKREQVIESSRGNVSSPGLLRTQVAEHWRHAVVRKHPHPQNSRQNKY